jgi:hypothetical protein
MDPNATYPVYIGPDRIWGTFTSTILKATKYATLEEADVARFNYIVTHPELIGKVSILSVKYKKNFHPYTEAVK